MNDLKCEKCGAKMIYKIKDHTQGWYCPNCEYSCVTSYFNKIELDETVYVVELLPDNDSCLENVKTISKLGNCNFIIAKKILNNGGILIQDKAINIHDKISELNSLKIKYIVTPNYLHK